MPIADRRGATFCPFESKTIEKLSDLELAQKVEAAMRNISELAGVPVNLLKDNIANWRHCDPGATFISRSVNASLFLQEMWKSKVVVQFSGVGGEL
jgi:hypothetical protein